MRNDALHFRNDCPGDSRGHVLHVACDRLAFSHTHARPNGFPFWLVAYRESGCSLTRGGGRSMRVDAGWLLFLKPGIPYSVTHGGGEEPWVSWWISFRAGNTWETLMEALPDLPIGCGYGLSLRGSLHERMIAAMFREALECLREGWPQGDAFLANTLERIILWACAAHRTSCHGGTDARIADSVRFLRETLEQAHGVPSLARRVHLSAPRFAALFRKETGVTPMRYLERVRIARAQEMLLSTGEPVHVIARLVGFPNPYHFSTRFRRCVGQSPAQYRALPQAAPLAWS